jgi:hypothetical protein
MMDKKRPAGGQTIVRQFASVSQVNNFFSTRYQVKYE